MYHIALIILCILPIMAYGQVDDRTRFFIITELGNAYEVAGPPPERLPGFDSAPYLNMERLNSILSVTASGSIFDPPFATFGQADSITRLPDHHAGRTELSAVFITGWGSTSHSIYSHFPAGELRYDMSTPYLGPGMVGNRTTLDILGLCNVINSGVSCVNNRSGHDLTAPYTYRNGHTMDLPAVGRTIIHITNTTSVNSHDIEVFFTCPACQTDAKAYYGQGGGIFRERGFLHGSTTPAIPVPKEIKPIGRLKDLAWDSTTDAAGVTYWNDGGACIPALGITGSTIHGICSGTHIEAGTIKASIWQALMPGWNSVTTAGNMYIIVIDPGPGAKLQMRAGSEKCCKGFDGGIKNYTPKAVVIHDTDRHLLIIPHQGHIPSTHPAIQEMHHIRWETQQKVQPSPRQISHSDSGDTIYHGMWYDGEVWPPYMVRQVNTKDISFKAPSPASDIFGTGINHTDDDIDHILDIGGIPRGLLSTQIYDIRNDISLLTDEGIFKLWNGTDIEREYIRPWLSIQKNPIWEAYGVTLPPNEFVIVDMYATIPIVRPTSLSDTYLSSLPCGRPNADDLGDMRGYWTRAIAQGGYDTGLIQFLFYTNWNNDIQNSTILQHVYMASRTYLDYIDGAYLNGDEVHIPILPNRPYLCTIISPNILESQYNLYALPFARSYVSLGGTEGTAHTDDLREPAIFERVVGVQSPRDGIVSLDVTAGIGAAVSAFGSGDAALNYTKQWINGTIEVTARIGVGEYVDAPPEELPLLMQFDIDLHDIIYEKYTLEGDRCYGRFATIPDDSPYVVKTYTASASLGEHIPIKLWISTKPDNLTAIPEICRGTQLESYIVQYTLNTFVVDVR